MIKIKRARERKNGRHRDGAAEREREREREIKADEKGWTIERFMVLNMLGQAFVCSFAYSFCSFTHSSIRVCCCCFFCISSFYLSSSSFFVLVTLTRCRCHLRSENAAVSYDRNEKFVIQLNAFNVHTHTRNVWLERKKKPDAHNTESNMKFHWPSKSQK